MKCVVVFQGLPGWKTLGRERKVISIKISRGGKKKKKKEVAAVQVKFLMLFRRDEPHLEKKKKKKFLKQSITTILACVWLVIYSKRLK